MSDQWYTAKCSYRAAHAGDEPAYDPLQEYRYFLVRGSDDEDAKARALRIAESKQHSYRNQFGATVSWKLEGVVDVKYIFDFELKEGLELYHEYSDVGPDKGA